MKGIKLPDTLIRFYQKLDNYRQQSGLGWEQLLWLGFMLIISTGMTVLAWPYASLLSILFIFLLVSLITWVGFNWSAVQFSVALQVFILVLLSAMDSTSGIYLVITWVVLFTLILAYGLLVFVEMGRSRFSYQHVGIAYWLAINSSLLLVLLRWLDRPSLGLEYASLPLASQPDSFMLAAVGGLILFVHYLRQRVQGKFNYLIVLPATLIAIYSTMQILFGNTVQSPLPAAVLEHGMLLLHVPVMILVLVFITALAGVALLRFAGELKWFSLKQNIDVLETIHLKLDEYQLQLLRLIIILLTLGLISGMFWSAQAWGHYWLWEAKQLLTVALWLYCLAVIHLQMHKKIPARLFTLMCLLSLPMVLVVWDGTNLMSPGLHNFNLY